MVDCWFCLSFHSNVPRQIRSRCGRLGTIPCCCCCCCCCWESKTEKLSCDVKESITAWHLTDLLNSLLVLLLRDSSLSQIGLLVAKHHLRIVLHRRRHHIHVGTLLIQHLLVLLLVLNRSHSCHCLLLWCHRIDVRRLSQLRYESRVLLALRLILVLLVLGQNVGLTDVASHHIVVLHVCLSRHECLARLTGVRHPSLLLLARLLRVLRVRGSLREISLQLVVPERHRWISHSRDGWILACTLHDRSVLTNVRIQLSHSRVCVDGHICVVHWQVDVLRVRICCRVRNILLSWSQLGLLSHAGTRRSFFEWKTFQKH